MKLTSATSRLIPAAALAALLAGCASDAMQESYQPFSGSEKFPIEVASGPVTLAVPSSRGGLQPAQANTVAGFAREARANSVSIITVRRPSASGPGTANGVVDVMTAQGIARSRIKLATYPGPASAPVEISYMRTYARTEPCGNWSTDLGATHENTTSSNFGCAVQSNIAAEVVNPQNFIAPAPVSMSPAAGVSGGSASSSGSSSSGSSSPSSSSGGSSGTSALSN